MKKISLHTLIVAVLMLLTSNTVCANDTESPTEASTTVIAEVIWVEFDGVAHHVYLSALVNDSWSEPESIYQSNNPLTTPTLNRVDSNAQRANIAVWTEQRKSSSVLMQSLRVDGEGWLPATLLQGRGTSNMAPNLVLDLQGNLWLFWSGANNGLSDIQYRVRSTGSWSPAQIAHSPNEVPDLAPTLKLLRDGTIQLNWQSFSLAATTYVNARQEFRADQNLLDQMSSVDEDYQDPIDIDQIQLPRFLPQNALHTLFIPQNLLQQSRLLP